MRISIPITALAVAASGFLSVAIAAPAASEAIYGPELEGFTYPYAVKQFDFFSQGKQLHMAYMETQPASPNGQTVVLMHGKNFCAATWEPTIKPLVQAGYRVIAPDQIGFCKSSKPALYQFSFQQLAHNTQSLLKSIGVKKFILVGHSTGGMLAVRYALMYPEQVGQLVLVNPIGLEDWKAKGVPSITVDEWYQRELGTTAERIRRYEQATYYAGQWRAEYDAPVEMLAGMYRGPGKEIVAWNSALLYDMIYTQPVVYEFGLLKMPTLLLIGQRDTTAIGKDLASAQVKAGIGHYPELGRLTAKQIPNASLVELPSMGHAPQIQDPDAFNQVLLKKIAAVASQ